MRLTASPNHERHILEEDAGISQGSTAPIALDSHCRYSQGTVHSVDDRLGTYSGSGHPQHPPLAANPWQALAEVSPGVYLKRGTSSCLSANFVNGYFGTHDDDTIALGQAYPPG